MNYTSSGPIGGVAFRVRVSSSGNMATPANSDTITWGVEQKDIGSNFGSNQFTAPIDGLYQMSYMVGVNVMDSANDHIHVQLRTSNVSYEYGGIIDPGQFNGDPSYWSWTGAMLVDMDASDVCWLAWYFSSGSTVSSIRQQSWWSGVLVA
jgi:hypothetical protein